MEDAGGQFGSMPEANPTTEATANDVVQVKRPLARSKVIWRMLLWGAAHFGSFMMLSCFRYTVTLEQGEVDSTTGLRIATDAAKKELDGLLNTGRQACGSLQIAGSSDLTAIGLTKKLLLMPGLVADWKQSSARGGSGTALTLAKAHYP
jgi:hypothetical protein